MPRKKVVKHPLVGKHILRMCTDVSTVSGGRVFLLLSEGFIVTLDKQSCYDYHDCDPSARTISVEQNSDVCNAILLNRTDYKDIRINDL